MTKWRLYIFSFCSVQELYVSGCEKTFFASKEALSETLTRFFYLFSYYFFSLNIIFLYALEENTEKIFLNKIKRKKSRIRKKKLSTKWGLYETMVDKARKQS